MMAALERVNTVHALDRADTVIDTKQCTTEKSLTQEDIRLVNNAPKNNSIVFFSISI
jgi:hypothetical protein